MCFLGENTSVSGNHKVVMWSIIGTSAGVIFIVLIILFVLIRTKRASAETEQVSSQRVFRDFSNDFLERRARNYGVNNIVK